MRLIDADEFEAFCYEVPMDVEADSFMRGVEFVLGKIDVSPTIDAVPVVRCKDCMYCEYGECIIHQRSSGTGLAINEETDPNGYCHRAERKKE